MKRTILHWMPLILCGAVIFYLSSSQPISVPVKVGNIDLLGHTTFYALLALLASRAFRLGRKENKFIFSLILVLMVTSYGALIELCQSYIPFRDASFSDGIANFCGAFLGVSSYLLFCRWRKSLWRKNDN